jgi:hypothetical protein
VRLDTIIEISSTYGDEVIRHGRDDVLDEPVGQPHPDEVLVGEAPSVDRVDDDRSPSQPCRQSPQSSSLAAVRVNDVRLQPTGEGPEPKEGAEVLPG